MAIKFYTRRDSATSALRKLGVDKSKYNSYIETKEDGVYVDLESAANDMDEDVVVKKPRARSAAASKPAASVKKTASTKTGRTNKVDPDKKESMTKFCQRMILDGKTDAEIYEMMIPIYNCDESKKGYPSWNRGFMRRRGLLPAGFDTKKGQDHAEQNAVHKFED